MQDLMLLAVLAPAFILCGLLMTRLDRLLEKGHAVLPLRELRERPRREVLWIGLSSAFVEEGISDAVAQYSRIHSGVSVRFCRGSEEELMKGLSAHRLNVVFLPEGAALSEDAPYMVREVFLRYTPVFQKYKGLSIEPITNGRVALNVLWPKGAGASFARCFVDCLKPEPALQR